jgi:hypothetical protein
MEAGVFSLSIDSSPSSALSLSSFAILTAELDPSLLAFSSWEGSFTTRPPLFRSPPPCAFSLFQGYVTIGGFPSAVNLTQALILVGPPSWYLDVEITVLNYDTRSPFAKRIVRRILRYNLFISAVASTPYTPTTTFLETFKHSVGKMVSQARRETAGADLPPHSAW